MEGGTNEQRQSVFNRLIIDFDPTSVPHNKSIVVVSIVFCVSRNSVHSV